VYVKVKWMKLAEGGAFVFVTPSGALTTHGFFHS
jgi:hypothetical protein